MKALLIRHGKTKVAIIAILVFLFTWICRSVVFGVLHVAALLGVWGVLSWALVKQGHDIFSAAGGGLFLLGVCYLILAGLDILLELPSPVIVVLVLVGVCGGLKEKGML